MIKRTLFFANAVCLTTRNKQLVIKNKESQEEKAVPIEDIGFVVIENQQIYIYSNKNYKKLKKHLIFSEYVV